jgi:hypothetical protein
MARHPKLTPRSWDHPVFAAHQIYPMSTAAAFCGGSPCKTFLKLPKLRTEMHLLIRIKRALPGAIKRATDGGALHPLWDVILDAEQILEGKLHPTSQMGLDCIAEDLEAGWTEQLQ